MRKAQVSFFVIVGIILVIMVATFVALRMSNSENIIKEENSELSDISFKSAQEYFDMCTREAVIKSNLEIGMNEKDRSSYQNYLNSQIKSCMLGPYEDMKSQGYDFVDSIVSTNVDYEDNTLIIKVTYSIEIEKDNKKFVLSPIEFTFDKGQFEELNENLELNVVSSDNRARITIPAGTKVEFEDGSIIDSVGIKVIEKNFDGLSNSIVVGNLVYEGLPDGAEFSKPVEISIRFRFQDFPVFTNEKSLSIAWWDEDLLIWRGLDTEIENGVATARIDHFTRFAIVTGCSGSGVDNEEVVMTPYLFKQEYEPILPSIVNTPEFYEETSYDGFMDFFCGRAIIEDHPYWIKDDKAIALEKIAYMRTVDKSELGAQLSVQETGETVTYGPDGSICDEDSATLNQFCCYNPAGIDDLTPMSYQDCVDIYEEESIPILLSVFEGDPTECPDSDPSTLSKEIQKTFDAISIFNPATTASETLDDSFIGYNEPECVGGKVTSTDGDKKIFTVEFAHNGDTCLAPYDAIKIENYFNNELDIGEHCVVTPDRITMHMRDTPDDRAPGNSDPFDIGIEEIRVEANRPGEPLDMCAYCNLKITIRGTGVLVEKAGIVCDNPGETMVDQGICKTCVLDTTTGLYLATEDGGDCSCTRQIEGKKWCDYDNDRSTKDLKICLESKLVDWTKENDPEPNDYIYYVEQGGCTTCTPDKFGENPCEKAVSR